MKKDSDFQRRLIDAVRVICAGHVDNWQERVEVESKSSKMMTRRYGYEIICEFPPCGKRTVKKDPRARFCSPKCRKDYANSLGASKRFLSDNMDDVIDFIQSTVEDRE